MSERNHVRFALDDEVARDERIGSRAHHLDLGIGRQRALQDLAHHRRVVDHEDLDHAPPWDDQCDGESIAFFGKQIRPTARLASRALTARPAFDGDHGNTDMADHVLAEQFDRKGAGQECWPARPRHRRRRRAPRPFRFPSQAGWPPASAPSLSCTHTHSSQDSPCAMVRRATRGVLSWLARARPWARRKQRPRRRAAQSTYARAIRSLAR